MGTFSVAIGIGDARGETFEEMEALVDTGATTTVIPGSALRRLGIAPTKSETFVEVAVQSSWEFSVLHSPRHTRRHSPSYPRKRVSRRRVMGLSIHQV